MPISSPWNLHVRSIQFKGCDALITAEDVTGILKDVALDLDMDCDNPLTDAVDEALTRARTLFCDKLDAVEISFKPTSSCHKVICTWCAAILVANSSIIELHIATGCVGEDHPQFREFVRKQAQSKSAVARLGKVQRAKLMDALNSLTAEDNLIVASLGKRAASSPAGTEAASVSAQCARKRAATITGFMDRPMAVEEIRSIDAAVARFIYAEGLPLAIINSPYLGALLRKLNVNYADKTELTDWSVRHAYLAAEHNRVELQVQEALDMAPVLTLITDGWSGVQKRHLLNVLLSAGHLAVFIDNVHTGDNSVTGEYQFRIYSEIIRLRNKIKALCTDNAAVMLKTWRLLRSTFPFLFTYGCGGHGLNLLAKDICQITEFKQTIADVSVVVNYFNNHIGAGGLATLRNEQQTRYGKQIALTKPVIVRWNSQVDAAQTLKKTEAALVATVKHAEFKKDPAALKVKALILEKDGTEFWTRVSLFETVLDPVRLSIVVAQAQSATLADVYACFVSIYTLFNSDKFSEELRFESADTLDKLLEVLVARLDFLIHPLHFVCFAFHPLYAKISSIKRAVVRKWTMECIFTSWCVTESTHDMVKTRNTIDLELDFFFGPFMSHQDYAHCWRPEVFVNPVRCNPQAGWRGTHWRARDVLLVGTCAPDAQPPDATPGTTCALQPARTVRSRLYLAQTQALTQ